MSITFELLTFSLSHIGYEYSTTAVLPRLLHSKAESNNEVCTYTGLQVHTKRPQWRDKKCHCSSQPCKKSGAQNRCPDKESNHGSLDLHTVKLPFYYSLVLLSIPPIQVVHHILNQKKAPPACTLTLKGGGVLDYRPTNPEYNSKRGGSQTFDPPTQAGAPPPDPPPVNLIPYKRLHTLYTAWCTHHVM